MDVFSKSKRSEVMRSVKSRDTGAELMVRSLLHSASFRYRLHRKNLPGNPDIVFPGRHKAIFVHGCFWHQHPDCHFADRPVSNPAYWNAKLDRNIERDANNIAALERLGWKALIVWECSLRNKSALLEELLRFLRNDSE